MNSLRTGLTVFEISPDCIPISTSGLIILKPCFTSWIHSSQKIFVSTPVPKRGSSSSNFPFLFLFYISFSRQTHCVMGCPLKSFLFHCLYLYVCNVPVGSSFLQFGVSRSDLSPTFFTIMSTFSEVLWNNMPLPLDYWFILLMYLTFLSRLYIPWGHELDIEIFLFP